MVSSVVDITERELSGRRAASAGGPSGRERGLDEGRSHRRDTAVTTLVGLATYGLSVLTGPLLARSLGSAGRGTYAAVFTPTQLLGWLLMLGIPAASAYYARTDNRRQLDNGAWLLAGLVGIPACALLWPLVPLLLYRHPPASVFWFRLFLVLALFVLPTQNAIDYVRAQGQNIRFNVYRSLSVVGTAIGVVGLFVGGGLNLANALFATWLATAASMVIVVVAERAYPRLSRACFERRLFRLQLHYGARVFVGSLSNLVLARFDQFLMVTIVAPAQLGLYAIAVTAAGLSTPIAQGVSYALFPHLRNETDLQARNRRMWQAVRWVLLGSTALGAVLAGLGPWAIPALMGEEFRDSLPAFFVLLPGQLFWNLGLVFKTRLEADNRPGAGSSALALAAAITVVGVPVAVPLGGIVGAAGVTTISQAAFCGAGLWFVRRAADGTRRGTRGDGKQGRWEQGR